MVAIECYYTNHFINQTVVQFFSKSLGFPLLNISEYKNNENVFVSYGILRGAGNIIKKRRENFIYIDHGYFNASARRFTKEKHTILGSLDGYFRVVKNDLYFNNFTITNDKKRFNDLGINLKDRKSGEIVILSEPTENTLNFLELNKWKEETIKEIKKYTDREIIVHNKFSEVSLKYLLDKAFAFVSCQSTAGFHAVAEGVPAFFTHNSLKRFGDIKDIEKNQLNHDLLYAASNTQWKLKEFFTDEFEQYIYKIALD